MSEGRKVDRFVLTRRLGAGGMGEVWEATDPTLGRAVAIKLLRSGRAERLIREARAMARLDHPNVITVHDVGQDGDAVWIAMELALGGSLRDWLETRPPWREVVRRLVAAGRGLAAAHAAGLVHRDFKPDNVLVRADGAVVVADFGLAREDGAAPAPVAASASNVVTEAGAGGALTAAGSMVGTPAYMAPEQHLGRDVDARADQFGFCVALWEGVHGERPFVAPPGELSAAIGVGLEITSGRRRPPPATRRVPGWLRAILDRGLMVERDARFPSMDAVVAELERGLARRRRTIIGAVAVAALVVVAAVGVAAVRATRPPPALAPAPAAPTIRTLSAGDDAILEPPVFSPDGRALLVATRRGGTSQLWSIALADAETHPITDGARGAHAPRISGDWLYWQLERPDGARDLVRRRLAGTGPPDLILERVGRADAAGAVLAWTDALPGLGQPTSVNLEVAGVRRRIDLDDWGVLDLALAPTGRQLAMLVVDHGGTTALVVVPTDRVAPPRAIGAPDLVHAGFAWLGDGHLLALRGDLGDRTLVRIAIADGRERVVAALPDASLLAVGPAGQLAFVDDEVDHDLWSHSTGDDLRRLTYLGEEDAMSPTWARDTDRLAYLVLRGDTTELRVAAGADLTVVARRPLPVARPYVVLSRDGRRVAYTAHQGDRVQLVVADVEGDGSMVVAEVTRPDHLFPTDFTPGDERVLHVRAPGDGGPTAIWDVPTAGGDARLVLDDAGGGFQSVDGGALLFVRRVAGGPVSGVWIQPLGPDGAATGSPRPVLADEPLLSYRFFGAGVGELVALTARRLLAIDLATGAVRELARLPVSTVDPDRIAAHPDRRVIVALGVSRQSLQIIDRLAD